MGWKRWIQPWKQSGGGRTTSCLLYMLIRVAPIAFLPSAVATKQNQSLINDRVESLGMTGAHYTVTACCLNQHGADTLGRRGGEGGGGWDGGMEVNREFWACRSPDWLWGSAVDRALVEREWRREAAEVGDIQTGGGGLVTDTTALTPALFTLLHPRPFAFQTTAVDSHDLCRFPRNIHNVCTFS